GTTTRLAAAASIHVARSRYRAHRGMSHIRYCTDTTLEPSITKVRVARHAASSGRRPRACSHHVHAQAPTPASSTPSESVPVMELTTLTLWKLPTHDVPCQSRSTDNPAGTLPSSVGRCK